MKNLILTTSFGYKYEQLSLFLRSLKKTGFDGDLVIFVSNTDARTIAKLKNDGVIVKKFFYPYRRCYKLRNPLARFWPLVRLLIERMQNCDLIQYFCIPVANLMLLRNLLYRRFLQTSAGKYEYVFLTDLRDVYFQGNPFQRVSKGELRVFLEEPNPTLEKCPNNSRWLRELYGETILNEVTGKTIACAGTILGDCATVLGYLDDMLLALRDAQSVTRMGVDQGIYNYLVHTGRTKNVTFLPNRDAEILTMGLMPKNEVFQRDANGKLVDRNGTPYALLHQFDRQAEVAKNAMATFQLSDPVSH
ncbi:MAG: hypothetical protein ABI443_04500 [Chthoniobacterales bacterium]